MPRIGFILLCTLATVTAATAQTAAPLATEKAQNSYVLGQELAKSLEQTNADLDINALLQGLRDNLEGKPSLLSSAALGRPAVMGWPTVPRASPASFRRMPRWFTRSRCAKS